MPDVPNFLAEAYDSTAVTGGSAVSVVVAKPTGTAEGDLMLAFLGGNLNTGHGPHVVFAAPVGWTPLERGNDGDYIFGALWSKVAGASEASTYTFTFTDPSHSGLNLVANGHIATYTDGHAPDDTGRAFNTAVAPSVTALNSGRLVCWWTGVNPSAITPPGGMAEKTEDSGDSYRASLADEVVAPGPTGTRTASFTGAPGRVALSAVIQSGIYPGSATLRGVATSGGTQDLIAGPSATLRGVATTRADETLLGSAAADLQGVASFTRAAPEGTVSPDFTVFDAYIEDMGLIFHQDDEGEYRPSTVPEALRPVRQDTGNNPHEVRPEVGDFFSQAEFSGGAGQLNFHRPGVDPTRYYFSDSFDISKVGHLRHAHAVDDAHISSNIGVLEQAGGLPWVADGTDVRRGDNNWPGTWTAEDPSGASEGAATVQDLAAEGARLFAALGAAGVHVRSSAGTWTHFQPDGATDLDVGAAASRIAWLKDRLFVVGGTASRSIFEVVADSTPTALETLPEGWVFEALFEMGPYVYACVYNRDAGLGRIHHYGQSDPTSPFSTVVEKKGSTAWPRGQLPFSGVGFGANVGFVGIGRKNISGGLDPVLYQVQPDGQGFLQYTKLYEETGSGGLDLPVKALEAFGETVLCSWSLDNPEAGGRREGIAALHVARTAFAPFLRKATPGATTRQVRDVMVFKDRVLFSLSSDGLYYEDVDNFAPEATLITSVADWNNAGKKAWDLVEDNHDPLPADTSVVMEYTTDHPEDDNFLPISTHSDAGATGRTSRLTSVTSQRFCLRLTTTAASDGSAAPSDLSFTVRSNPVPDPIGYRLTRFVRLLPKDRKDEQGEVVTGDPVEKLKALQDLQYTWVTLREPGLTWVVRVESVAVLEPIQPTISETGGTTRREGFIVSITMSGSREN